MKRLLITAVALFGAALLFGESRIISIYTYHTHAPFIVAEGEGLSYDLATYLSEKSSGKYRFRVLPMTRARIDRLLEEELEGIIPWVSPAWFSDCEEIRLRWVEGYLMRDGNTVISSKEKKIEYRGPGSVIGLIFGGVRGHHYQEIDDLVESGSVTRLDNENHLNNFRMLEKGRIDFTIAPLTGSEYIIKTNSMEDTLYISRELHSAYFRRIIVSHEDEELLMFLQSILAEIQDDDKWNYYVNRYK